MKYIEIEAAAPYRYGGIAPVAALLFFAGRPHVVAHRSVAERDLLDRGALHVGMVTFDGPTLAGTRVPARLDPYPAVGAGIRWGSGRN
ncbi:MAG: hypothetical protein WD766_13220 [Gemmatimonadota bacterium]